MTAATVSTTPGQLIEVTLPSFAAVKLVNVSGGAPVWFTLDGPDPIPGDLTSVQLAGTAGATASTRAALRQRGRSVRLVSTGTTLLTVHVATVRTLTVVGAPGAPGVPGADLDVNVAALLDQLNGVTRAALLEAFAPLVGGKIPAAYLPDGYDPTDPPSGSGTYPAVYPATY